MARSPVLAAGGIVLRPSRPPQIAVVRLRKGEWVLPKGKLDDGETPRDAAMREVLEETGHDVAVHEFLGTLAYDAGGRPKIVHYWRMETQGGPARDLMRDVTAVDWLPLEAAVERLSRDHERAFLANVGPLALEAAAVARRSRETKVTPPAKRPRRRTATKPTPAIAPPVVPLHEDTPAATGPRLVNSGIAVIQPDAAAPAASVPDDEAIDAFASLLTRELAPASVEPQRSDACASAAIEAEEVAAQDDAATAEVVHSSRINVMQRVRSWLRRVG